MANYSPTTSTNRTDDPVANVRQLIEVALDLADTLALPGVIGAHLDHALELLRRHAGMSAPAPLAV